MPKTSSPRRRAAQLAKSISAYPHGRVPAELRREHILAVAEELFGERGYNKASMDELARRACISKPVVYDLVGDKECLFRTCMARLAADLEKAVGDAVRAETDMAERMRVGSVAFFAFVDERRATWMAIMSGEGGLASAEAAAIRRNQARLVMSLVRQEISKVGLDVDNEHVEALAYAINGAFEALAAWWSEHPDWTVEELAALAVELFTPGLLRMATEPAQR